MFSYFRSSKDADLIVHGFKFKSFRIFFILCVIIKTVHIWMDYRLKNTNWRRQMWNLKFPCLFKACSTSIDLLWPVSTNGPYIRRVPPNISSVVRSGKGGDYQWHLWHNASIRQIFVKTSSQITIIVERCSIWPKITIFFILQLLPNTGYDIFLQQIQANTTN